MEIARDNGFKLLIGIGGALGCVQYSSSDGSPPYLVAVAKDRQYLDDDQSDLQVEFLAGDTPTPIPMRRCLPYQLVKQLVVFFFRTGDRSPDVLWEEV